MINATPFKSGGQLLFSIAGDDNGGHIFLTNFNNFTRLGQYKLAVTQSKKQIIGEFARCFVYFINQQNGMWMTKSFRCGPHEDIIVQIFSAAPATTEGV